MTKVIFFFAGTGDEGQVYRFIKEGQTQFQEDVLRIYITGCQEAHVGNGSLFPDLELAANNIRNAFEGNELNLDKLRENLGGGLSDIIGLKPKVHQVHVDDITLEGFSRGAVTTFATAKKLDDLDIPMHIIANQPVPGESGIVKGLYSKYCDLTGCRNVVSAHTFLSSYNLEQNTIHNYFFRQMVAKFAPEVNAQHILFPHQNHWEWFRNSPIHSHINKLMAENDLIQPFDYEESIKKWYQTNTAHYFTPHEFMQIIYGAERPIGKDPIYLNVVVENAERVLAKSNMQFQDTLNPEQAAAIIAIARLPDEQVTAESKIELYELIVKDSKRAAQFIKIINKVTEVCDYLPQVTRDFNSAKSQLIERHAAEYKKSVFMESFEYLSKSKPNMQDKEQFADTIYKAECKFREQALGIDRDILRTIFKLLTNFITHITGIAIIVNTINKAQTGNWLLFQHNRSENAVRDTRKELLSDLDKLDDSDNKPEP